MSIQKHVTAPLFVLEDIYGRTIKLADYADRKVMIAFFRHAGCPFCNLRVHALSKIHQDLQAKGMEMIFFFESKAEIILRSTFHKEVSPIPIISDPQKVWYNAYGLEDNSYKSTVGHLGNFIQTFIKARSLEVPTQLPSDGESYSTMPAEFLLDRGLVVKDFYYSQRLSDRMNLLTIKAFAEEKATILA